jgi:hypothetical protein
MSKIFLSHSSLDNAFVIALRDWLDSEGWGNRFIDVDAQQGIVPGDNWERAVREAMQASDAALFLISKRWLESRWCRIELDLAIGFNKRLFCVLIDKELTEADLPKVASDWQIVNLATGRDHKSFAVTLPHTQQKAFVDYSLESLMRLKTGLWHAGLLPNYFKWPPDHDLDRPPYRGLRPLEAEDAGIFFGREAPIAEAIEHLHRMTEGESPRLLVVLGASGAGKSSFLRAGVLPRLARESQTFLPLPVIRPERAAIDGDAGLVAAMTQAFAAANLKVPKAEIREAVKAGADKVKSLLVRLRDAARLPTCDGETPSNLPMIVLAIDQSEELFTAEAQTEAKPFLALLRDFLSADDPAVIAVATIRTDKYERLQTAPELDGLRQQTLSLPVLPRGSYAEVVKGPIRCLDGTARALKIDDELVDALFADIEAGAAKDALPLLAFTLERLYDEYGTTGRLTLAQYIKLGRVKGSIEAAVDRAFKAADTDQRIPANREARLRLLRRGLIPWLADVDPATKEPRRRVARLDEIPAEARPLIDLLVEQRLLSTDRRPLSDLSVEQRRSATDQNTEVTTIEPAHEALLRQWGQLERWLEEDANLLVVLDEVQRAASEWKDGEASARLNHSRERLAEARRLRDRTDLAARLTDVDWRYLAKCKQRDDRNRRGLQGLLAAGAFALVSVILPYGRYIDYEVFARVSEPRNWSFSGNGEMVSAITDGPDGRSVVNIWQLAPHPNATPVLTTEAITAVLSPDGRHVAVSRRDGQLYLLPTSGPVAAPEPVLDLRARADDAAASNERDAGAANDSGPVYSQFVQFSKDGKWLIALANDGNVVVFDAFNAENRVSVKKIDLKDVNDLSIGAASERVEFLICDGQSISLVRWTPRLTVQTEAVTSKASGCSYAARDKVVVLQSEDYVLSILPVEGAKVEPERRVTFPAKIQPTAGGSADNDNRKRQVTFVVANDAKVIFGRVDDGPLARADLREPGPIDAVPIYTPPRALLSRPDPGALLWASDDGKWFAGTAEDGSFRVWQADAGTPQGASKEVLKRGAWAVMPIFSSRGASDRALLSNGRGVLIPLDLANAATASKAVSRLGGSSHGLAPYFDGNGWQATSTAEVQLIGSNFDTIKSPPIENEIDVTIRSTDGSVLWATTEAGIFRFRYVIKFWGASVYGREWPRILYGSESSYGPTTSDGGRVRTGGDGGGDGGGG